MSGYDELTEVLTSKGGRLCFKLLSDITQGDEVVVLDNNQINTKNFLVMKQKSEGILFENERISVCCSNKQRILVGSRKKYGDVLEEVVGESFKYKHTQKRLFKTVNRESYTVLNAAMCKLAAFFVSDGHIPIRSPDLVIFRFKRERKIRIITELLSLLQIHFVVKSRPDKSTSIEFKTLDWMNECYTKDREKCLPLFMFSIGGQPFQGFMEGLLESDGCVANQDYNNTSEQLIDEIQAVFAVNGVSFNKRKYNAPNKTDLYKVKFQTEDSPVIRRDKLTPSIVEKDYYSLQGEKSLILTRRYGIVLLTLN